MVDSLWSYHLRNIDGRRIRKTAESAKNTEFFFFFFFKNCYFANSESKYN